MPLNLLDDIFLLHLALEPPQCILKRFTFLQSYFSHLASTPKLVPCGLVSYCKVMRGKSSNIWTFEQIKCRSEAKHGHLPSIIQLQRQLDLARRIGVQCLERVGSLLVVSREVIEINVLIYEYELAVGVLEAVCGGLDHGIIVVK